MRITKEIKIALVAIVSIVLLFFGMNFLKGMTLFSNGDSYYITFKDISGLSSSSPIFANGYRVGVVNVPPKGGSELVNIVSEVANGRMTKAEAFGFSDIAVDHVCRFV